jgi:hypothetical protein
MYLREAVLRVTHMMETINVDQFCGLFIGEEPDL